MRVLTRISFNLFKIFYVIRRPLYLPESKGPHHSKHRTWSGIKLQCAECGYSVGTKQKFKEHMKKHEDVASLRCQECDYVGKQGYIIYIFFVFFCKFLFNAPQPMGKYYEYIII